MSDKTVKIREKPVVRLLTDGQLCIECDICKQLELLGHPTEQKVRVCRGYPLVPMVGCETILRLALCLADVLQHW